MDLLQYRNLRYNSQGRTVVHMKWKMTWYVPINYYTVNIARTSLSTSNLAMSSSSKLTQASIPSHTFVSKEVTLFMYVIRVTQQRQVIPNQNRPHICIGNLLYAYIAVSVQWGRATFKLVINLKEKIIEIMKEIN